MMESGPLEVTKLLGLIRSGDVHAREKLFSILYEDLRARAARLMRGQPVGHTLQATALLSEAYIRLAAPDTPNWKDRGHFMAVATAAMKCVLIDHARSKGRKKRGGDRVRVPLAGLVPGPVDEEVDILELAEALERFSELDARAARVVELRFFGGLSVKEAALVEGVSTRAAERDWAAARAWLREALS